MDSSPAKLSHSRAHKNKVNLKENFITAITLAFYLAGMAEVGAMCSSRRSCAIVEDDGLSASYTIAHEVKLFLFPPGGKHEIKMCFNENNIFKNFKTQLLLAEMQY